MLIYNQERTVIINFKNLLCIGIENKNKTKTKIIANTDMNQIVLGIYDDEEMAKKILNEIIGIYLQYMTDKNMGIKIPPKIYKMPLNVG